MCIVGSKYRVNVNDPKLGNKQVSRFDLQKNKCA